MPADAINYYFDTNLQILQAMVPQNLPGEGGFQTASMKVDFYGPPDNFLDDFPTGTKSKYGGKEMYFSGTLIEGSSGGWTRATVYTEGYWENPPLPILDYHEETEEIRFPFVNGAGVTISYIPPGKPNNINPLTGKPWNVKVLISKAWGTKKGVRIGTAGTALSPPSGITCPFIGDPPRGISLKYDNLPDPTYTVPNGWVRTGFDSADLKTLGSVVFRTYTEKWNHFLEKSIG